MAGLRKLAAVVAIAFVLLASSGAAVANATPPPASGGLSQQFAVLQAQVTVTDLAGDWARHQRDLAGAGARADSIRPSDDLP